MALARFGQEALTEIALNPNNCPFPMSLRTFEPIRVRVRVRVRRVRVRVKVRVRVRVRVTVRVMVMVRISSTATTHFRCY